jgi:hypothetical protein
LKTLDVSRKYILYPKFFAFFLYNHDFFGGILSGRVMGPKWGFNGAKVGVQWGQSASLVGPKRGRYIGKWKDITYFKPIWGSCNLG